MLHLGIPAAFNARLSTSLHMALPAKAKQAVAGTCRLRLGASNSKGGLWCIERSKPRLAQQHTP